MEADELAKLEAEVAELEKAAGIKKERKKRSPATSPKAASNGKGDMPAKGTPEWEAWQQQQAAKSNHGGYEGPTLLQKMQGDLDAALRRMDKMHLGSMERERALGRTEGLARGVGILRDTSMAHEIAESKKRIGVKE